MRVLADRLDSQEPDYPALHDAWKCSSTWAARSRVYAFSFLPGSRRWCWAPQNLRGQSTFGHLRYHGRAARSANALRLALLPDSGIAAGTGIAIDLCIEQAQLAFERRAALVRRALQQILEAGSQPPGNAIIQFTTSASTSARRISPSPLWAEDMEPLASTTPAVPLGARWWTMCWSHAQLALPTGGAPNFQRASSRRRAGLDFSPRLQRPGDQR